MSYTYIKTDNEKINIAYHIAVSDLYGNIKPFKDGLLNEEKPVMIAGMGYCTPWTRDASINTYNAGAMLYPEVAKDTLLAVVEERDGKLFIGGEYWDLIIWAWGIWSEYLMTGDKELLKMAYEAIANTLELYEETEFTEELNLFRGAACYGDGIAAYPDVYASHGESGIISFAEECRDKCCSVGVGLPMHSLSTNCLYFKAYEIMDLVEKEIGIKGDGSYRAKAEKMREAINTHFWNEETGKYRYLIDDFGNCESDEGMGNAFVIMFGIANEEKAHKVLENQHVTAYGIPCVYPSFDRYKGGYGRHSGTVWPHIQSFWADAAAKHNRYDLFDKEFNMLTECSVRDGYFSEIYHPDTGERYGGLQEFKKGGIIYWESEKKQTWSATGYLHMIFCDIIGMNFGVDKIEFTPYLPDGIGELTLGDLTIKGCDIKLSIKGQGSKIKEFKVNGEACKPEITYDGEPKNIEITVE